MTELKVRRLIRAFYRETGEFAWEIELRPGVALLQLQTLLGVSSEDPMYDAFVITLEQAAIVADLGGIDVEGVSVDLFVEAESVD